MSTPGFTVLIVEDEFDDADIVRAVLYQLAPQDAVRIVPDAAQALTYLHGEGPYGDREQFPLPTHILLDLNLPGMNGFGLLKSIRDNPAWRRIQVFVLSDSANPQDMRQAYRLGASGFRCKPLDVVGLREEMATLRAYWVATSSLPMPPPASADPLHLD